MAVLLKSDSVIDSLSLSLSARCLKLKERGVNPKMHVFLVGENPASVVYVRNKKKLCEKIGAICEVNQLAESVDPLTFERHLLQSAQNSSVHGIFVQLPVPKQLSSISFDHLIPPVKDVDGFHAQNIFGVFSGFPDNSYLRPCTPKGILTLLDHYKIPLSGKSVLIIGRSKIVGRPLALLLLHRDATVTMAHSKTTNLRELSRNSDIIVAALGRSEMLDETYFRATCDQTVIDVGINRRADGKLVGDVKFDAVQAIVGAITPVPGGIGPMTVVSLIDNLLIAAELQNA
ncbi:MAG: bifunctional methylenetetrahydrofolate dehydrogenase/methenyltetrahydrofolate cyclohydrolase [Bdellovibrio sp.]|nr:bifunctional methylenetetrahydrofolate dehydrogenase/methenyltetrahydrofolate cyclohydrolase [Bdellovibrio sp.]